MVIFIARNVFREVKFLLYNADVGVGVDAPIVEDLCFLCQRGADLQVHFKAFIGKHDVFSFSVECMSHNDK